MKNRTTIRYTFILLLLLLVTAGAYGQKKQNGNTKPFTLVIDPGHGGVDPGALGKNAKEKDINLKVSKLFAEMVKEAHPEVKIIFTRTTDVQVPLMERANIANNANADLFISIHSNSSKNRSARGCETFTLGAGSSAEAKAAAMYENEVILSEENFEEIYKGFDPRSSESYIIFELMRGQDMERSAELAQSVQKGLTKNSKLTNRGVSSAGFLVLHRTVMPKILVELGFISNREEEVFIASGDGQRKLAKGIFEGFSQYYSLYGNPKSATKTATPQHEATSTVENADKIRTGKAGIPVFKVQIFATDKKLKENDKSLKGVKANFYKEGNWYKYTYGESSDYDEILRKKKEISKRFSQAFIVAFIDGKKVNTQEAIKIFKKNKQK